ncbi:hypothetical protein C3L33_02941, partial [Rhododendron williamsianum]
MGAGRKKKTLTLKEKPQPSNTVNCSVSARNLRKSDLGGLFLDASTTRSLNVLPNYFLVSLPGSHFAYVKNIRPGMPLFLFNYSDRKLHGIFEAVSAGQMNIDPYAWTGDGAASTPYPAQVEILDSILFVQLLLGDEDSKTQPSDLTIAHSNLYNTEWESSSMMPCLEGESQNFEALQEDSAMWNEEQIRAGSESGGEVASSSFQEGTIFEALVNDTKQEGEHGDTVVLCENLPRSDGSDMGWDSACATPHMSGEIQPSEAFMHADVTKDVAKVDEEEVSEHSYSSPDNHGEASDGVDSESGCSSEALAVADMESVVAKLIEEIEGLKDSQLKQVQKIGSLEKELEAVIKTIDDTILLVGGFDGSATLDGELYVFGGVDAGTWHDTVESYNPTNDQWVSRPSLNQKKGSLAGASLYGKIYAIGGGNGVECYAEVEMLDMNIGRWITTRSMLQKRFAPAAAEINDLIHESTLDKGRKYEHEEGMSFCGVVNGKLYALGGYNGAEMVPTVEIFDPRLGLWMLGEPMNYCRGYSGAAAIGEKIFVIGGLNESDKILDTVECYKEGCVWEMTNLKAVGKRCYFSAIVCEL